eukprot:CAMPEP_0194146816 /NCGR_PEP_ID=MMETSP0152-20130528/21902_1 /TAXON_ID=1049557 /ORGANISM="Thalassiothrix antarctica, Strain L6-D1" /LENGTH=903 /DNA_ID=CAMNT_0038847441 /DNA_START=69 /DNA_END=2780 /DNA_ORIENTATION=+
MLEESQCSSMNVKLSRWKLYTFVSFIFLDGVSCSMLTLPFFFWSKRYEDTDLEHYTLYGTLYDLGIISMLRLIFCFSSVIYTYCSDAQSESPFKLYHRNGDRKTLEELENEALEEDWSPWLRRYCYRPAFTGEVFCFITGIGCVVKCLARLNVELGVFGNTSPIHPLFWITLLLATIFSMIESIFLDSISSLAGECGRFSRSNHGGDSWMRRIGSNLSIPLLLSNHDNENESSTETSEPNVDMEQGNEIRPDDIRGVSDITADPNYKAKWRDLLAMISPDSHLIFLASIFLLVAAASQIYIPTFTGRILDSLAEAFSGDQEKRNSNMSVWDVPGFISNVVKLLIASIACGIFSGLRGSIFTIVGGRTNVRLRIKLMDSLLVQDIGFFDVTKTGDITSRLSSDTTLVGDQVTLNVNVFLRSFVQVIGVLIFMFMLSWQLSLLAFISVPVITALSKVYGQYVRRLTKLMQKKLADGNSVSEAALGSMTTVRAFDAAESELREFENFMKQYLNLNVRSAIAYFGYATAVTSLPNLVTAVVLFYGGLLVRDGKLTSGQLVSFLLYLQSLSDAFSSIGYIFSSLTQAVGAADKVFELLHRTPKMKTSTIGDQDGSIQSHNFFGINNSLIKRQRNFGISPSACEGMIKLANVELYYPARPQRRVLDNLSFSVTKGSVVALVGPSGSGKSSVMSLMQHLYDPSKGRIMIDGHDVHELSPKWISRYVSVVSQEPTLFARSIAKNIIYGLEGTDDEPTLDEIKEAAQLANANSFIEKLPFGYDTDVGERGVQLSGGQKQRIAIARALVRKPRILLLDEATSALDAESEALVQEAIDEMIMRGRGDHESMTVLIVAHRLSTVRNADTIFVIQDGKVVEEGSHDQLIVNEEGAYSNLVYRQLKARNKLEDVQDS